MPGTWQPNDPASFIQPDAFEFNRGLASNDNRAASANNGLNATTSSIEWTEHVARLNAAYRAPWNFLVSGSYTLQKGRWSGPILDAGRRVRPAVRAADGDTVERPRGLEPAGHHSAVRVSDPVAKVSSSCRRCTI